MVNKMARYIDADALTKRLKRYCDYADAENFRAEHYAYGVALNLIDRMPTADVVEIPKSGIGDLSDGYHTFNELYHHRAVLFSAICNSMPDKAWKSKLHDTGDMYEGMFIVGIETPNGQATYHYDIEPYWDMFKVKEFDKAPKWDGHTPAEAIKRIADISSEVLEVRHGEWLYAKTYYEADECHCSLCGQLMTTFKNTRMNYCPHCGARMDGERKGGAE